MITPRFERYAHRLFQIGVFIKGADGILETVGGLVLFFVPASAITGAFAWLVERELEEDPGDIAANTANRILSSLTPEALAYGAVYLFLHGVIKLFLVWGLWRGKLWSYPLSIILLGAFVAYQLYRYAETGAIWLLVLSVIDAAIVVLVWHEYRYLARHPDAFKTKVS